MPAGWTSTGSVGTSRPATTFTVSTVGEVPVRLTDSVYVPGLTASIRYVPAGRRPACDALITV